MTASEERVPLSSVIAAFTPEYIMAVIDRVLQCRDKASGGVRKGLDAAINKSLEVPGFSHSSKAQPPRLREPMVWQVINGNDRLTGEVLRAWAESQKELQVPVKRHLSNQDIPVDGPNLREGVFNATWPRDEWNDAVETVIARNPAFDRDDVGMMLSYLSGLAVGPEVTSPLLAYCLDQLDELPIDAPDWEEIDVFIRKVTEMAEEMAEKRAAAFARYCRETLQQIQRDFADELQYLELDLAAWEQAADERPASIATALELAEELRDNLTEYQEVRPQAPSRKVEAERAPARAEREAAILAIAAEWELMLAAADDLSDDEEPPAAADAPGDGGTPADEETAGAPAPELAGAAQESALAAPPEEYQSLVSESERLKQECGSLKTKNEELRSENEQFAKAIKGLKADNQSLDSENSDLKARLSPSRDLEEYWRRFYGASPFEQVGSVNEAVSLAQELFPTQLVFALNSRSEKESPFQKPAEALAALAWLATDYHHLRWTKSGEEPRFDERLKKSCPGWSYKPHQASTTKQQFAEWYTTRVAGRRYELGEHLGKGTSADPQNTLRIAFAWDDERGQVVVGYIGQHQKNRRS